MQQLIFDIALPADRYLAWYQGRADRVWLRSRDGRSISLPAHHLRRFLHHDGIYGSFVMRFTDDGKLHDLQRL